MSVSSDTEQLIARYEDVFQQMQERIKKVAGSYKLAEPLSQLFTMLHKDLELQQLEQELCEIEKNLPKHYRTENPVYFSELIDKQKKALLGKTCSL